MSAGGCGGTTLPGPCRPRAFAMNTAICPRVSGEFGQKFPPPHPAVIPESASASTNWKNGWSGGTSPKVGPIGASLTTRLHQTSTEPKYCGVGKTPCSTRSTSEFPVMFLKAKSRGTTL